MALAGIGPLTSALEAAATAVGAGILLGSFTIGARMFVAGAPRRDLEERVVASGYWGGIASIWAILADLAMRYGN